MTILIAIILFLIIGGAIAHEYDLSKNFKKTGNASAWFFEIKTNSVHQQLPDSESKDSPSKSLKDIVFGKWHLCNKCNKPVTNGKNCRNCDDL